MTQNVTEADFRKQAVPQSLPSYVKDHSVISVTFNVTRSVRESELSIWHTPVYMSRGLRHIPS